MADVDLLLTEGQLKHARDIMLSLGYTIQQEGGNHDVYPDRAHMEIVYPFLKKVPYLLPLGWLMRGLRVILFRRSNIKRNLNHINSIREADVRHMQEVQKQSGFI